ncbi:MAG: 7-cyano-7-deazaguanine synthase [Azospirillum sp.]|nr:7-cyano-7-deazaguanine synthase [Azospirillum sp.]
MVASSYHAVARGKRWIERWIVGLSSDDEVSQRRIDRAGEVARFNCMSDEKPSLFIFPRIDVREQLRAMPRALADLTWSCRRPQPKESHSIPCGKCQSCARRTSAFRDVWPEAAE